jgi:hypothetical protein
MVAQAPSHVTPWTLLCLICVHAYAHNIHDVVCGGGFLWPAQAPSQP